MHLVHAVPWRPEGHVRISEAGVKESCEPHSETYLKKQK